MAVARLSFTAALEAEAGLLETAIHEAATEAVPYPDVRDGYIQVIEGQLDQVGRKAFVRLQDLMDQRQTAAIDAAIRLSEPVKATLLQAIRDNWTVARIEREVNELARNYQDRFEEDPERLEDGAA